jgi:hypothetical protein
MSRQLFLKLILTNLQGIFKNILYEVTLKALEINRGTNILIMKSHDLREINVSENDSV